MGRQPRNKRVLPVAGTVIVLVRIVGLSTNVQFVQFILKYLALSIVVNQT